MTTAIQGVEETLYQLLLNNWNSANTSSITPKVSTGWYDRKSNVTQVSVGAPEESELGGRSGYFAMRGDGTGPVSRMDGSVDVHCWAHRQMSDVASAGVNPKKLVHQMSEEVKRIVRANYDAATDLDYIKWDGRQRIDDADETPVLYRMICIVTYQYQFAA